jgi:dihydroflavonol-4-reductase
MKDIYIITGANGFLGNNIVRQLCKENNEIRCLVTLKGDITSLKDLNCKIYRGDVTKLDSLKEIFTVNEKVNLFVIHCAAIVSIKSKYDDVMYNVNVNGTKNIVKMCLKFKAKLIYVNSVHSLPVKKDHKTITEIKDFDPNNVEGAYAKTKAEAAKYVLDSVNKDKLKACIIQPSGIIGPNDYGHTHLSELITNFANGKLNACVKGRYNFVDVRDVAKGIISACKNGQSGECYILSNKYISIIDLLNMVSKECQIKEIKFIIPMWIAKLFAPFMERYYVIKKEVPMFTSYSLYTLTVNSNFSYDKAYKKLNYIPRDIKDTIHDTIEWFKKEDRIK